MKTNFILFFVILLCFAQVFEVLETRKNHKAILDQGKVHSMALWTLLVNSEEVKANTKPPVVIPPVKPFDPKSF
jgi:hypothetical protein